VQWITIKTCSEVRFIDALLRFVFGQGLHISHASIMRVEHDGDCVRLQHKEDACQHMYHEIHWGDIVVMNDDAIERFERGFCLFGDIRRNLDL
jgi:hypothetical protein